MDWRRGGSGRGSTSAGSNFCSVARAAARGGGGAGCLGQGQLGQPLAFSGRAAQGLQVL